MIFTVNGSETRVAFSDATLKDGKYLFTCYVNSIQMAENISAVFHYAGNKYVSDSYSISEYLTGFDEATSSYDQQVKDMVHALADYGHYVQLFLDDHKSWSLGEDYIALYKFYKGYEESDISAAINAVSGKGIVVTGEDDDISAITQSLTLDSTTAINLYFTLSDGYTGSFEASVGGEALEPQLQSDGRYKVSITGISAHELGQSYTVTITTNSGSKVITVSALSYVKAMFDAYPNDDHAKNAAVAIYNYSKAADDIYAYLSGSGEQPGLTNTGAGQ